MRTQQDTLTARVINPHSKGTQKVRKWSMDRRDANFGQRRADVIDGR